MFCFVFSSSQLNYFKLPTLVGFFMADCLHNRASDEQKFAVWHCWMQGSTKGDSSNPVPVEKHNIRGFMSCPDVSCLSFLFFPFFSVCSCCWICPPFRWLVAMLLSSLCSLALWWIVYGFPSSILHFCIDGLGFQ